MKTIASSFLAAAVCAASASSALAWGEAGHVYISKLGAEAFPTSLPEFVRTPQAVAELAALGPELDRSKDAGKPHDSDLDPGHYVDLGDDGAVAGVPLNALPPSRAAYDTALRAKGQNEYREGYLPYSLIDGWQQIAKDFAIWRVDRVGEKTAASAADRARFASDRELREILTLRDIGVWGHYVGDASQPLHVSVHYDGWGDGPNPDGFTTEHGLHARFETAFVREHATDAGIVAKMTPLAVSDAPIATIVGNYLAASNAQVVPLYRLEKAGAFAAGSADAVAFVDARLAAGASAFRDLVTDAWNASATVPVGYPNPITAAAAESGARVPTVELVLGGD